MNINVERLVEGLRQASADYQKSKTAGRGDYDEGYLAALRAVELRLVPSLAPLHEIANPEMHTAPEPKAVKATHDDEHVHKATAKKAH